MFLHPCTWPAPYTKAVHVASSAQLECTNLVRSACCLPRLSVALGFDESLLHRPADSAGHPAGLFLVARRLESTGCKTPSSTESLGGSSSAVWPHIRARIPLPQPEAGIDRVGWVQRAVCDERSVPNLITTQSLASVVSHCPRWLHGQLSPPPGAPHRLCIFRSTM